MATILDHIEPIEAPKGVFKQPHNEYWALICLKTGLDVIYQNARTCDEAVRSRLNPDGSLQIMTLNDLPGLPVGGDRLLTMAFHWYATTLCQYARTIAAIGHNLGQLKDSPAKYVHRVLPEVLPFRDKISAHFAWATRNPVDSDAERKISIMPPLGFMNDRCHVQAWKLITKSSGKASSSEGIPPWSITKVHEDLRPRYWPEELSASQESSE